MTARAPVGFHARASRNIARLFPDYRAGRCGTSRRPASSRSCTRSRSGAPCSSAIPWVAMNLFKAFEEAKQRSAARVADVTAARIPLPWSAALAAEFAREVRAGPVPVRGRGRTGRRSRRSAASRTTRASPSANCRPTTCSRARCGPPPRCSCRRGFTLPLREGRRRSERCERGGGVGSELTCGVAAPPVLDDPHPAASRRPSPQGRWSQR